MLRAEEFSVRIEAKRRPRSVLGILLASWAIIATPGRVVRNHASGTSVAWKRARADSKTCTSPNVRQQLPQTNPAQNEVLRWIHIDFTPWHCVRGPRSRPVHLMCDGLRMHQIMHGGRSRCM